MQANLYRMMVDALKEGVDVTELLALAQEQVALDKRVEEVTGQPDEIVSPSNGAAPDWKLLLEGIPKWDGGRTLVQIANSLTGSSYPDDTPGNRFVHLSRNMKKNGYTKKDGLWHSPQQAG